MVARDVSQNALAASVQTPTRLTGPSGASARFAAWDSVLLDMTRNADGNALLAVEGGRFSLELWQFYEGWRVPVDSDFVEDAQPSNDPSRAPDSFRKPGQPRASMLEREETRVMYRGCFTAEQAAALKLRGFSRSRLNQTFVEDRDRLVDGLPTWWSGDGCFFIYFARDYSHWKINALRAVGGDGLQNVGLGARRVGCGFAHSGVVERGIKSGDTENLALLAATALLCSEGWFQLSADEWVPIEANVIKTQVARIALRADSGSIERVLAYGENSSREARSAGSALFHGICEDVNSLTRMLLFLPSEAMLDANSDEMSTVDPRQEEQDEYSERGDPDIVEIERPAAKL